MNRAIAKQAADWALRLADGAVSDVEQQALDAWLQQADAHRQAFVRAQRILGDARIALRLDAGFTRRLLQDRDKRGGPITIAVIALLVAIGAGGFAADLPLRLRADVLSTAREMPRITLSDGSRVTLNGESAIAEAFNGKTRRVTLLKGEAYFEVARDPNRPFTVMAGAGRVEARGTAFDVNLVDGQVDVTVTEHTVAVTGAAGSEPVLVPSGRRLAYDAAGILGKPEPVPPDLAAPWRSGRLVFDDRPLAMVAEEIFRHLPGRVLISSAAIARRRISGSFDLADPDAAFASFASAFQLRTLRVGTFLTVIY